MDHTSDVSRAAAYWDREHQQPCPDWMSHPAIREYINAHFEGEWPLHWFRKYLGGRRFRRALSIGCGTGSLERFLVEHDLCDRIDAFDASVQSLATARSESRAAGHGQRIRYFAADFNAPVLPPETYDAVFFHQSMHHVERLESLLLAVLRTIKSEGLVFLDEYVGPSRIDWTRRLLRPATEAHASLPADARVSAELLYPIQADDPSEAIRSGEIIEQLRVGFDLEEVRGYGGNILSVLFPAVKWDVARPELLKGLIDSDAEAARSRPAYYAVVIAHPKRGGARTAAEARYASGVTWTRYRWRRFIRPLLLRGKLGVLRRLGRDARW